MSVQAARRHDIKSNVKVKWSRTRVGHLGTVTDRVGRTGTADKCRVLQNARPGDNSIDQ